MQVADSFRGAALATSGPDVVFEAYRGLADVPNGIAVGAHTRFQIASISKQFAAACILLLERAGVLTVGDPVATWVPGSPPSWSEISLADLMAHTAGLGHWPDYPAIDPMQPIDDEAFVAVLRSRALPPALPAPHAYSSPGYGLLARVVERASGVPYARFVGDNVFGPLQMRETFVGNGNDRDDLARGYHGVDERPSWDLDTASKGAGDVWTTARDLDRWDEALFSDALLPDGARRQMFHSHAPIEGLESVTGYGFGWLVAELHGRPLYLHTGDNPGYVGFNAIVPTARARVIVLSNDETVDVYTPAMELLEAVVR